MPEEKPSEHFDIRQWGKPRDVYPDLAAFVTPPVSTSPSARFNSRSLPVSGRATAMSAVYSVGSVHFSADGLYKGLNGVNPGVGLAIPLNESGTTSLNIVDYRNSYADQPRYQDDRSLVVALHYKPEWLQVDLGDLRASAGVMAGLVTTNKGSYADHAPLVSNRHLNVTALGVLTLGLEHKPSGLGVEASILPPLGKDANGHSNVGFVGLSLIQKFKP